MFICRKRKRDVTINTRESDAQNKRIIDRIVWNIFYENEKTTKTLPWSTVHKLESFNTFVQT